MDPDYTGYSGDGKSGQTDHFAVWSLTAALVFGAAVLLLFCGKTGAADDETWREM